MALTKAIITNLATNEKLPVLFNPTEYSIAKQNQWQAKPIVGKNVPKMEFTSGGSRTTTMDLLWDDTYLAPGDDGSTEMDDINSFADFMWALMMIDEKKTKNAHTNRGRPPFCLFQWGSGWHFTAVLTNMTLKYTMFSDEGGPLRVTATCTFQEAKDDKEQPKTNPTSGSLPGYRRRMVKDRDTLPLISFEEYGDSTQWRHIAEANDLHDPMALESGMVLAIPPLS